MPMKVVYANVNGQLLSETRAGSRKVYIPDALGNTVALMDSTGALTDTFDYFPSGTVASRTGTTPTPFQWVGNKGYYRDNSKRVHVRARNFYVNLGRWAETDPIGFEGGDFNLYRYVKNRFVVMIDPSGLWNSCDRTAWNGLGSDCKPKSDEFDGNCWPNKPNATSVFATFISPINPAGMPNAADTPLIGFLTVSFVWQHTFRPWFINPPIALPIFPSEKPNCPSKNYSEPKTLTVPVRTSCRGLQFKGAWWKKNGPIPPSDEIEGNYSITTKCHPPSPERVDINGYTLGSERFAFRISPPVPNAWAKLRWGPVLAKRNGFEVHPDGSKTGVCDGTLGCLGIQSEAHAYAMRSCLTVLNILGTPSVPLTVSYLGA